MNEPSRAFDAAIRLHRAGRLREAIAAYAAILAQPCDEAGVRCLLGTARVQAGEAAEGMTELRHALALDPNRTDALNSLGNALLALGQTGEALASYDRALALRPDYADAQYNRANCLGRLGRHDEALLAYDRVLTQVPGHSDAAVNRGLALHALGRLQESVASYDRALAIDNADALAHFNRANSLKALGRLDEAVAAYDRAVALLPRFAVAHNNRGNALHALGRYEEALASFDRAIEIDPANNDTPWNKSLVLLLLARYAEGWPLYERRLAKPGAARPECAGKPAWRGEPWIRGERLLVHAEQGYGDVLQACRYLPQVRSLGAEIVLEVPAPLAKIVTTLRCPMTVVTRGGTLPAFDAWCPIMSLPGIFAVPQQPDPAQIPYLHANAERVRDWRDRLGPARGLRIGLAWSGSSRHADDAARSIPLARLRSLFRLSGIEWHALQNDLRLSDRSALADFPQIRLHDAALADFADTAALIECMDRVISVDTSVAHLAGALGKPLSILLAHVPDFRWLLERRDTPWYPGARLYRQPALGDWESVIGELERDLVARG
jgi:tetratricopeptide (TPR) repeat protein